MKIHAKKIVIAAITVAAVAGIGTGIYFWAKKSGAGEVNVISVSAVNNGYWGNDTSISGMVTSDVSQDVYLYGNQKVDEIFVKEGDEVKVGTPLMSYDMTLMNLELEIEKLNKEGLELKIQMAEKELEKLKKTKPSSGGGGGITIDPGEIPGEEPELYPDAVAYDRLDFDSLPYNAKESDGSEENPYRFLCKSPVTVTGAFMNKVAGYANAEGTKRKENQKGFCVYLEMHMDDEPTGTLLKVWWQDGREITEPYDKDWEVVLKDGLIDRDTPTPKPTKEPAPVPTKVPTQAPTAEPIPTATIAPTQEPEQQNAETPKYSSKLRKDFKAYGNYPVIKTAGSGRDLQEIDPEQSYNGYSKEELQRLIKEKEQSIKELKLDVKESELKIENSEKQMKDQTINSTINGVVKKVGDPQMGSANGEPVIQVISSEGLYVKGTISELMLEDIQVGQQLTGMSWESGMSFDAEIREISPYPVNSDGYGGSGSASFYPFTAYIAQSDGLRNQEYVELSVNPDNLTGMDGGGIYLESMFIRQDEKTGENYVFIDDGGRLKKQKVELGKMISTSCYEITDGLTEEDKIAFPYGKAVKEGSKTKECTIDQFYQW